MSLIPFRQTSNPDRQDADLHRYAASGDAEAFRRLVERHLSTVQEAAARVLGTGSPWLDDVAQDVFLLLARKARQLPQDTVVCAWLHRHAVRRAIDLIRSEDRRRKREAAVDLMPEPEDPESVWNTISPRLDQELLRLPRQDQEVLTLRFMERCSSDEAARRLGLSSAAVRKRLERALAKLRERLAAPLPGTATLSVTALAAYLSVPTAKAAPAAKVAAITGHCLAAPAAPAISFTTFSLMTKSQIYTTSAIVAIGAGAYFAGRTNGIASAQADAAAVGSSTALVTEQRQGSARQ
ncbi:RNA polymerase sigma factor [Haloferula sp. BvORR071]|uniref:RNA polymerase sigma factor n=1 Tax=Haloferula sp. BvORR071 TaxID=1396141 RepID=UPI00055314D3|nr:RNA polymerase sigma factor [Haloferula sp. BvORR071]